MGKASHQCTGSRSRERHQENLWVFLVVCFKCGTFSLTKEKMSFLAIFGRYHTLFLGFLAKKVFYLKIFSKSSSIKGWFVLWKEEDFGWFLEDFWDYFWRELFGDSWGGFSDKLLGKGHFSLKEFLKNLGNPLWEFFLGSFWRKFFLFGKSFGTFWTGFSWERFHVKHWWNPSRSENPKVSLCFVCFSLAKNLSFSQKVMI